MVEREDELEALVEVRLGLPVARGYRVVQRTQAWVERDGRSRRGAGRRVVGERRRNDQKGERRQVRQG